MKKTFKLLSSLFIGIVMCFVMISCYGSKNSILEKIQNELGFVVEGGSFEQGSTLVSNVINQSSSEWNDVIEKIANQNYDENQEIFIYDIFVEKDGKEVQPNEKVKLSIPSPFEDGTNVVIYHVKSEGVETITPTYINGNLVFETSGFSYFVVAKQEETKKFNLKISVSYPGSVEVTNKETGQIVDRINEYSTRTLSVEEGQTYTISCDSCDAQYIFLGWYDQYGSPSMSESEPLSKEETFDFVMRSEDVTLTPYFVRKIDGFGFGTIDNPVVFEEVNVFEVGTNIVELLFQAQVVKVVDGFEYPLSFDYDYLIDYSDLDCEIPGEYTVTYKYRWEENFEKKITIIIEAKKYDFVAIVHQGIGGSLSLLAISDTQSISMSVPANEVMTLTAAAFDGYRFVGWYEVDIAESGQVILKDTPVSTNLTYEYVTKECNYMVYAVFEEVPTYNFTANQQGSGGYVEVVGTEYTINENTSYSVSLPKGTTITLKANVRSDQYRFLGWFEVDDSTPTYLVLKDTPVSTETTFEHVMEESSYTIYAVFEAKVTSLILDAANAGFTEGVATYTIGDEFVPNPEYVLVYGVTVDENIYLTLNEDYTIDLGGLDFNQAGTYTITYTYLKDSSIQATLVIEVVEKTVYFQATVIGHGKIYYNDVEQAENGYNADLKTGSNVTLVAVAEETSEFVGWFTATDIEVLISSESSYTFTIGDEDQYVFARFEAKVTSLILDAANAGFTEGVATYTIGDEFVPNPEYVLVYGVTGDENIYLTLNEDYTIDLGGLDFNQVGTYTITYTYLKDSSIQATLVIEVVEKTVYFQATVIGHGKIYYNDVEQAENGYNADLKKGSNVTLVAVAEETSEFVGWFTATDIEVLISSESSYTFTIGDEDQYVFARFEAKVTSLILDAANAGFTEGEATYTIGDEFVPNPEYVLVYGVTVDENIYLTLNEDYTIDLGGLDFNQVGTYTITYTYLKDSSIQATLEVNVVSSEISADLLAYAGSNESSSRYNGGRAAYVFKSEFTYNGETCDIEDLGLFYEWRDRTTSEVIDVARDSTWDSTASHYPSPAVVGEYDFVVYKVEGENKVDMLTIHRTITEQTFALITDEASLSEYEDFTFVAKVDNSYYVMPTPMTTGAELEAIQVVPNENGVISLGNNYEYVFRPYDIGKTEADLTLYGMRTGHGLNRIGKLILWDNGLIEYSTGVSADYALTITFNEDYSVNVHNPYCHGTLHLVYDAETDRYLFTANTLNETRPTYPIFIYKEYEEVVAPTEVYEFYGKLDKQYDGEAVSVNIYKEINILTENGKDLFTLLKMGTIQFVWTDLKSNVLVTSTISEEGYIQGPSQVGSYQLVVQLLEKGETGMEWVDKAILTTFSILEA